MKYPEMRNAVREAIRDKSPGFKKGWISSFALNEIIGSVTNGTYVKILTEDLGYIPHPVLRKGRSAVRIEEGGKKGQPILYIHPWCLWDCSDKKISTREVSLSYIEDQQ